MPSIMGARCVRNRLVATAIAAVLAIPGQALAQALSLADALAQAAGQDLGRPAGAARVQSAEAAARQAAVRAPPSVGLDVENFAGSGSHEVIDRTETTLYVERTWERGAKLAARTEAARSEIDVARLKGQVRSLDLLETVQGLWVEAAAAQGAVSLAEQRVEVARALARETDRRVRAARDPLFAGERARGGVAEAETALARARDEAASAQAALAAYLGAPQVEAPLLDDPTGAMRPAGESLDLAVLEAEQAAAGARVRVEQNRSLQDPTLRAGLRHFRDEGEVAFVVGGSIPIGGRDAYRGAVERALAEQRAIQADIAVARAEREREIARLTRARETASAEIGRIDAEVTPSAQRAVDLVWDGFRRGGGAFTYLEVAEAQRALIAARARRAELLKAYHLDGARLDRLTARHLPLIASAETR